MQCYHGFIHVSEAKMPLLAQCRLSKSVDNRHLACNGMKTKQSSTPNKNVVAWNKQWGHHVWEIKFQCKCNKTVPQCHFLSQDGKEHAKTLVVNDGEQSQ